MRERHEPKRFARYRVTGKREYRDHPPGEEFVAALEPRAELRAIRRGDLELLERVDMGLADGMFVLPSGWIAEIPHTRRERGADPRRLTTIERGAAYGVQ